MTKHFFDIGANVGQTFDWFLINQPRFDGWDVWCFEPSPRHVPALLERVSRLNGRYGTVHVCPIGLGGGDGERRFCEKVDPRGDSFFADMAADDGNRPANIASAYVLHAPCADIVRFILSHTAEGDEVTIKLDAEGAEYEILERLLESKEALHRVKETLVEWHSVTPGPKRDRESIKDSYRSAGKALGAWMF